MKKSRLCAVIINRKEQKALGKRQWCRKIRGDGRTADRLQTSNGYVKQSIEMQQQMMVVRELKKN